jgi:hypothetical protein
MDETVFVAGTFADLERAVRWVCGQIDQLNQLVPDTEDHVYAERAKEDLWRMYESAYQHALARSGFAR